MVGPRSSARRLCFFFCTDGRLQASKPGDRLLCQGIERTTPQKIYPSPRPCPLCSAIPRLLPQGPRELPRRISGGLPCWGSPREESPGHSLGDEVRDLEESPGHHHIIAALGPNRFCLSVPADTGAPRLSHRQAPTCPRNGSRHVVEGDGRKGVMPTRRIPLSNPRGTRTGRGDVGAASRRTDPLRRPPTRGSSQDELQLQDPGARFPRATHR